MAISLQADLGGRPVILETGRLARQAGGAVTVRCGDTIVLVTVVVAKEPKVGAQFLPLTVDYVEKTFASGKIPGGFFKREGRPSEIATLTSRFIDRPVRPLFPEGYAHETQVIATVLSADSDNDPDVLAITGSSAALMISEAPFQGPIAGVRVGRIDGVFRCNPTPAEMEVSDIDLIVAASREAVVMVEGGAEQVPEEEIASAIHFAHESIQPLLAIQEDLVRQAGKPKITVAPTVIDPALRDKVEGFLKDRLNRAIRIPEKGNRAQALDELKQSVKKDIVPKDDDGSIGRQAASLFEDLQYDLMRQMILDERIRVDGRSYEEIRPITCDVGLLPRAHGSALFTRGETQALVAATLGTGDDEQRIDALRGEWTKRFMLHYNFPPFSVGEIKFLRSPGRREIGHGALAERALLRMIPSEESFPYTIRIVAEILESNGSSSMATVCGSSLSLMDAGVPIKAPVAGIAMGLVKEGERVAILSDILGDEDHLGDMDFKVAGTESGVTALQMDIKIKGVTEELMRKALEQARRGRLIVLEKMKGALAAPRSDISVYAPRVRMLKIPRDMIGALIGPGGKNIRAIIEETGAEIDVEDDGSVKVFATSPESMEQAVARVEGLTATPELGKIYKGKVVKIADFGAFVQILPSTDGLLHISQIDYKRVAQVRDVLQEGDEVTVKVIRIEPDGKVALSRKETMPPPEGYVPPPPGEDRPRRPRDSGPHDRDRRHDRGPPRGPRSPERR